MSAPQTFREWLTGTLDADQLADLSRYGADTGWPGMTYTADCVEVYERYADEIREALNEDTEAFMATWNRSEMLWSEDGRKTLLVWYMAERTAYELAEGVAR